MKDSTPPMAQAIKATCGETGHEQDGGSRLVDARTNDDATMMLTASHRPSDPCGTLRLAVSALGVSE